MPGVDFHLATLRKIRAYLPDWALKEIHSRALAKSGGKARWRTGEAERYGPEQISKEYLEATYDVVSEHQGLVPTWLFNRLHEMAFPSSGGIAKARKYKSAGSLEKTDLTGMTPANLKKIPDSELGQAWLRVNEWYVGAKNNRNAVEPFVNAGSFVYDEMKIRKFRVNEKLPLVKAIKALRLQALKKQYSEDETDGSETEDNALSKLEKEATKKQSDSSSINLQALFDNAPDEVLLVPDFVDFVGSSVTGHNPNDLDVLFRADLEKQNLLVQAENIQMRIQQVLDPEKQGLLHYINNPQGSHADYVPLYDLRLIKVNKFSKTLVKSGVTPGSHFDPEKPSMAGYTEFFDTTNLWNDWVKDELAKGAKLVGEIKFDGFRCIVSKEGQNVEVWYEDAQADRSAAIPDFVAAVKKAPFDTFVLDGEMCARWNGKFVPRTQTLGLLSTKPFEWTPYLCTYDCLYLNGEDISGKPLEEREPIAQKVVSRLNPEFFVYSQHKPITDQRSLAVVGRWASSQPLSEGMMVKDVTKPYSFGGSEDWAKLKTIAELKCCVLARNAKQNGYSYDCGLRDDNTPYTNKKKLGNATFIDLGGSFVLPQNIANVGDTINVEFQELIIQRADDGSLSLAWGKPTVRGPDKSRPAYFASQAVQVAREGHVLREEIAKMDLKPSRPMLKEDMPLIAFVGGSPDQREIARGESMVGVHGRMFKEEYLDPLGLEKSEVALLNIVPLVLHDQGGRVRGPNQLETAKWLPWINEELERLDPDFIIALGHAAGNALPVDVVLPHPKALTKSSRAELTRKIKRIRSRLIKDVPAAAAEAETRGAAAVQFWQDNWFKEYPASGTGRFVLHEHWRGLTKDELTAPREELIKSGHSVHSDLRLQVNDTELSGWTIFLGTSQSNEVNRFIALQPDDNLQATPKLLEPVAWLDYHGAVAPGAVGATADKFARFDIVDKGTYHVGVEREHYFEYFMNGDKLKGRIQFQFAPMEGTRVWIVGRPADQKPYAQTNDEQKIIDELKSKGQQYLVWSDPTMKPTLIDVTKVPETTTKDARRTPLYKADDPYNFDHTFELLSADDDENRLVTGIVYKPNELDTQREWAPPDELEKAARWWMEHSQATGIRHMRRAEARVTQSYIAPQDITIGNRLVKAGSWIVELRILAKKLWQEIKDGVYNAFSMGGYVTRTPGELPPNLSKAQAGDPSTIKALSDIQPLEITLCASGANKEKRFPLLKCAMCALDEVTA